MEKRESNKTRFGKLKKVLYDVKTSKIEKTIKPSSKFQTRVSSSNGHAYESGITESTDYLTHYQVFSLAGVPILERVLGGKVDVFDTRYGLGDDGPIPSRDVHTHETHHYGNSTSSSSINGIKVHLTKQDIKILGIPIKRFKVSIDLPKETNGALDKCGTGLFEPLRSGGNWRAYGNVKNGQIYFSDKSIYTALKDKIPPREMGAKDLSSKVISIFFFIGLFAGLFFLSSNITGNTISNLSIKTTSYLGIGLILSSFLISFFLMKRRKL